MLPFNVLCPIDFSGISARALVYAATLARWYDAHLELLHVVPAFEENGLPPDFDGAGGVWASRDQLIAAIQRAVVACPVLTVPPRTPHEAGAPVTFKKIVRAMDYSPSALRALQYGLDLGRYQLPSTRPRKFYGT